MNSERYGARSELSPSLERDHDYSGKIHIICPRHGEPLVYGDTDAKLSWRGFWQARQFAHRFTESLSDMPDNPKHVRVVWGDRQRTQQTGEIIHKHIAGKIRKGLLPDVTLGRENHAPGHAMSLFGPGATLGPLIDSKIPKSQSFQLWRTLDEDVLHQLGAVTPGETAMRLDRFFQRMGALSDKIQEDSESNDPGPEVFYIAVTSETTHGALLNKIYPERRAEQIKIDYAEPFEILIDGSQRNPVFNFRGESREYPLYTSVQSNIRSEISIMNSPRPVLDNRA